MTKAQRNIHRDEHTDAWIVEYRPANADAAYDANRGWVRVYEGSDETAARRAYQALESGPLPTLGELTPGTRIRFPGSEVTGTVVKQDRDDFDAFTVVRLDFVNRARRETDSRKRNYRPSDRVEVIS